MKIEVCCGSVDDAIGAQAGGADRIELNSALFLGGLTPTLGCFAAVKCATELPVVTMIRPRHGGFSYSDTDIDVMRRDIEFYVERGSDGIVFGVLRDDGTIDVRKCRELIERCAGAEKVFHRAIDVVPDAFDAIEALIDLGFDRVLTSGQAARAADGIDMLTRMIEHARGRIEILPGGGINVGNYSLIVEKTGCESIHVSPRRAVEDRSASGNTAIHFGGALYPSESGYSIADAEHIAAIRGRSSDG
ncbi:MAG: copper homeostasis protein CutC [Spirochaetaceae bacterium]|nr:MAG: copper homeostasis protein CutC [Spirochaetaceae bacterium]